MIPKMQWSRKGAKDNRVRLVWSKYYKYVVEKEEYYFKQKAYATYNDGWIDSERIKRQTYKNAVKRGNECIEVSVEENISGASAEYLILIFTEKYNMPKDQMKKYILKATAALKQIKEHSTMSVAAEYRVFKKILDYNIKSIERNK